MKKPLEKRIANSYSLNAYPKRHTVNTKLTNIPYLSKTINPRPSLIPGVNYPISDEQEQMLDKAWRHWNRLQLNGEVEDE